MDDRSNANTAIPALREIRALEDGLVTMDAMGCQKRIAQTIRDRGADYVLALKGQQLHAAVVETFAVEPAKGCDHDFHKTVNTTEEARRAAAGHSIHRSTSGVWAPTESGPTDTAWS